MGEVCLKSKSETYDYSDNTLHPFKIAKEMRSDFSSWECLACDWRDGTHDIVASFVPIFEVEKLLEM